MAIKTQEIIYQVNNADFRGYLAYDNANTDSKPGVLIVHEWWGHDDYVRGRAEQMAADGFIAFALDMYGLDKVADQYMTEARDTEGAIEQRFDAALDTLKQQAPVDPSNIYASGYCFGGAVVLGMARAGKALNAVASFHGLLETETPMQAGAYTGKIAVFNGADDPMVSDDVLNAFENEMSEAGVTCSLLNYPGVVHGFTNPKATERGEKYGLPLAHDQAADEDSYQKMINMFNQTVN